MSPQDPPRKTSPAAAREDRLAKALRDNLSRRKALARAKRQHVRDNPGASNPANPESQDDAPHD